MHPSSIPLPPSKELERAETPSSPPWRAWLSVGAVAFLYAWNLGTPELTDTDEARSGVIVQDMVRHGHWLLSRTPDGRLTEKPPTYYSLAAMLGTGEVALRAVSLAAALGTLALTAWITGLYGCRRAGLLAIASLATNLIFLRWARQAMVDMTLAFFVTAALASALGGRAGRLRPWTATVLYGLASGLATLTKGPLGLVLPAGIVAAQVLVATRGRFWTLPIPWRYPAVALLLAFLLPLPWYLYGYARAGWEFLETCLLIENVGMPGGHASGGGTAHQKSILYYFWNQLVFLIPLAPLLPETVRWLLDPKAGEPRGTMGVWFGAGLLLFLVAANKRHYYLLPLQPALAVMIGLAIDRAWAEDRRSLLAWGVGATATLLAVVGIAAFVGVSRPEVLSKYVPGDVVSTIEGRRGWIWGFAGAVLAVSAFQAVSLRRGMPSMVRGALALALVTIAGNSGIVDAVEGEVGKNRSFVSETSRIVGQDPVAVLRPFRTCGLHYYWPTTLGQIEPDAPAPGFLFMYRGLYKGPWARGAILAVRNAKRSDEDVLLVRWKGIPDPTPNTPR